MAKPSSKKVTRAARTSGGRTARGARPWGWYTAMSLVVVLGVAGIVSSREDYQEKVTGPQTPPAVNKDHWHAAFGIYVCDKYLPPIQSARDPLGIHTHNDGIIHIHPFQRASAGKNATLKIYADAVGMKVNATSFKVPGDKTYRDGQNCNGKDAEVQFWVNGKRRTGNPASYKMGDRDLMVLAFVPEDAKFDTTPPSAPNLNSLSDVGPEAGQPTPNPEGTPTTIAPAGAPTTTAPAGATTTTAAPPATTTTAAP